MKSYSAVSGQAMVNGSLAALSTKPIGRMIKKLLRKKQGGIGMAKHSIKELDKGQLDLMWNFLRMGNGNPDTKAIREHCNLLRQAMMQKTSGQGRTGHETDVPFEDVGTIVNCIVIEAMEIHLAGGFDILEKYWRKDDEDGST